MLNFLGTTFRSEESLRRTVSGSQYIGSFSMLVGLVLIDTTRCSIYLLGEEASPSIGNTLWRVSTMFTRSATTPDLDEIFGTRSILLGAGPDRFWARSAQKRERETLRKFCFFCRVNNARLCRFPVSQISRSLHTRRGSVRW